MITTYFDIETRALASDPPWNGDWGSFKADGGGGMSAVVCLSDNTPDKPTSLTERIKLMDAQRVNSYEVQMFDDNTTEPLVEHLMAADRIVSFNGIGFDIPVIAALHGKPVQHPQHIDILALIWQAIGKRRKGYNLNKVASRTVGMTKLYSDGASAPRLAREGRYAELFQYCLQDVLVTRALWHHIEDRGTIIGVDGEEIPIYDHLAKPC